MNNCFFRFSEYVEYIETVTASNNSSYADKMTFQFANISLLDYGFKDDLIIGQGLDFSLDVKPIYDADELINQLKDPLNP